jgi:DNA-directed RNA polymerase subunit alpha
MMELRSEIAEEESPLIGIPDPGIQVVETDDTHGRFSVEPLNRGLGTTLGNSMRRVLLSTLESAAITWVKIDGIQHEYSAIPHITEDVTEFLLNVKAIRFRSNSDQPGRLVLDVKGEGEVCAGDISPSADYEVVNPELHLVTLDSEEARLSVEFNVERGRGYVPATNNSGLPIGALPVDALFTPVRKVNFEVETIRFGQAIGKERLDLDVWTDGTISPVDAVREAGQSLVGLFFMFANAGKLLEQGLERNPLALAIPPEQYNMSLDSLGLSARTLNCLKRDGLNIVGEVLEKGKEDLLNIRNFGEKSLEELNEALETRQIVVTVSEELAEEEAAGEDSPEEEVIAPEAVDELEEPTLAAEEVEDEEKPAAES